MVKLKTRSNIIRNIRLVGFGLFILLLVIGIRIYGLQILQAKELRQILKRQHEKTSTISPKRGTIYDRNGNELATSLKVESLYAHPYEIKDKKGVAQKLSSVLRTSSSKILKKLTSKNNFVWLRRKLSPTQLYQIEQFNIAGIGFVQESQRFYPNKEIAAHVLGFVGIDSQGLEGVEFAYEQTLKGKPGYVLVNKDALGRDLFPEGIRTVDSLQGYDLALTIDKNIQYIAEKELNTAVQKAKAKAGIALVMNPWTGEILALAVAPLFNPNQIHNFSPETWRNRAVTDVFEPGSTFKTFLVASALEERLIKPRDVYYCENGSYSFGGKTIHDTHPYGWLSVTKIIKYSSNIGACKISKHIGRERFYRYIRKFGFGEETGIEFPGEVAGSLSLPYRWPEFKLGTIAFGQGISVTALQIATAYCTIANGGLLMRPYMIKEIRDENGLLIKETMPFIRHRVISEKTADAITAMLKLVVREGGTGEKAAIEGFEVAGKTGTAQKVDSHGAGYSANSRVASFAGFVPADNPQLTILVVIDEPQGITFGGETAAPAFSKMAHQMLSYLHVYPEHRP
jgi:cell division protein FtsI (penicillin-binding protein 3)